MLITVDINGWIGRRICLFQVQNIIVYIILVLSIEYVNMCQSDKSHTGLHAQMILQTFFVLVL